MYVEYKIEGGSMEIVSISDDPITPTVGIVAVIDSIEKFRDFRDAFNTKQPTQQVPLPSKIWKNISVAHSEQIYKWYLTENWKDIFKLHNSESYSDIKYCCARHYEVIRENLKLLGYGV